ncbi:TPA: DUF600 family protein [Acinetobacter baumannii]|nr:DUF600 family protein [Acinetobacter baumannii]QEI77350.1 DUF600 family protein [Acinetobacter baumannii]HCA5144516.1 DUF600 family protein [Acinetobacter baumannii]HCA5184629.1 DUF600 family protein [Acinetobacter baumannii]HEE5399886.1 DUF600 family protein [Acinetobacter baumannii]
MTQEIVNQAISVVDPGCIELILTYHVEDNHSEFGNSYLINQVGKVYEKALPVTKDLDFWFRKLEFELHQVNKQLFTSCKLHLWANGKYEASYGYDAVDWDKLMMAG